METIFYKNYVIFFLLLYLYHWKYFCFCYEENDEFYNDYTEDTVNNEFPIVGTSSEIEAPCEFRDGGRICNCGFRDEKMVLSKMNGNINQVILINCKVLRIPSNAFTGISMLSRVTFTNIEDLILDEYSLSFSSRISSNPVQIEFSNTIIEEMSSHAINGNINEINFINCKIGILRPFTISGIIDKLYKLTIRDTTINKFEPQAFKKFIIYAFEIINSTFVSQLPSRAIYDLEVNDIFRITNCNFTGFSYNSFVFQEVKYFTLQNNQIDLFHGGSFQMKIKESITIKNNIIKSFASSALQAITLDRNYFSRHSEPMGFVFLNNTLDIADEGSRRNIQFNSQFNILLSNLYIIKVYTCNSIIIYKNNDFFKQYADRIYIRMPDFTDSEDKYQYYTYSHIINHKCVEASYLLYIIIGVSILIIILMIILIVILIIWRRRRNIRKLNIVMPEPKTYRETQIVMQIENAGLLKTDM